MVKTKPVRDLSALELKRELGHIAKILASGAHFGTHFHSRCRGAALLKEACRRMPSDQQQGPENE